MKSGGWFLSLAYFVRVLKKETRVGLKVQKSV